ncbi:MAG TPA: hypothetical protein VJ740_09225 [Hyphomicrobiaceae bacterium]|jgi:hypothetical protein|nr:hypothetical protein [Hyphomicrobiaceae bacterium]
MSRPASRIAAAAVTVVATLALLKIPEGLTEENYESWAVLVNPFESTGGGGVMIGEYKPVIVGDKCVTDFTATMPDGKVYYNVVEFETVQVQGGTLCTNGAWRAQDGSASGTTPFRVFLKDGVVRRSP